MLNRRMFIGSVASFAALHGIAAERKPIFRIGFMTDTHVGITKKSCERVKGAFEVFKKLECAAVVHCGDLADWHYEEGYKYYLEELESAFPTNMPNRPQFLYVLANHDALDAKRKDPKLRASRMMDLDVAFKDMCARLKIDHWYFEQREIMGYPILIFPQTLSKIGGSAEFDKKIAKACADYPNKPVFVCTHEPSWNTCYNSGSWGSREIRRILKKYPQVVQFSGHTHGSLRNEKSIWQGEYTAVDVCCLQEWHGTSIGTPLQSKQAYGVVVMEVYADQLVIRRFDVRDGSEMFADNQWIVPMPFNPITAPFIDAKRKSAARPGVFAKDAAITCGIDKIPFSKVKVTFPPVKNEEDILLYRVEIARKENGEWTNFSCCEIFSEFYIRPQDRKRKLCSEISSAYFDDVNTQYRFSVTPVGFFGTLGKPLETIWTTPDKIKDEVVWSCENPMQALEFHCGTPRTEAEMVKAPIVPCKDGWFAVNQHSWLQLPAAAWNLPKNSKIRFIVEMGLDQAEELEGWNLYLRVNDGTMRSIRNGWTLTPPGKTKTFRYVVESTLSVPNLPYSLSIARGGVGKIQFHRLWIELVK